MHVELHDMLFQMNQIACWVTCMLNNMKFSMLVNMHVSEHDMLFSDEPTLSWNSQTLDQIQVYTLSTYLNIPDFIAICHMISQWTYISPKNS